ncbi:hypothetical protein BH11BAC5_BH11BAC5_52760 [soil metagenome]
MLVGLSFAKKNISLLPAGINGRGVKLGCFVTSNMNLLKSAIMHKKISFTIVFLLVIVAGCSKDFLKRYDKRIIGTWRIDDVDRFGFGGSTSQLPFTNGSFTFYENGTLDYTNAANEKFRGTWELSKKIKNEETVHSLRITAVDFTNQKVLSEYYDDMQFMSTNHFKANIVSTFHTYVTHFRR